MDRIRALRQDRGWSQTELAARAGVTRQLIGAVEAGRHTPNVRAALGLARALGMTVEELFAPGGDEPVPAFGGAVPDGSPVLVARVGDRLVEVPVTHGTTGSEAWAVADGVAGPDGPDLFPGGSPDGLVIAGCDPLLGLLAELVGRDASERIVSAHASTGRAIAALAAGRIHGAVVHAPPDQLPAPPTGARRWHLARWQVGLAGRGPGPLPSLEELGERRARVVQRDEGAGTQRALERALTAIGIDRLPGPVADGHLDVARRVALGGHRAGVTMEAAARSFGLSFRPLEVHDVELWLDDRWADLPAARALVDQLGQPALVRRVASIGGYDLAGSGSERIGRS